MTRFIQSKSIILQIILVGQKTHSQNVELLKMTWKKIAFGSAVSYARMPEITFSIEAQQFSIRSPFVVIWMIITRMDMSIRIRGRN